MTQQSKKIRDLENRASVSEVCDVLIRFGGLLSPTARHFDVARGTLLRYIERHPEAQAAVEQGREKTVDTAESVLLRTIEGSLPGVTARDQIDAAKFLLTCFAKSKERGYASRVEAEVTGKDGAPLVPLTINIAPEIYDKSNDGKPE